MYMILFVLHDTTKLHDILRAWDQAGVTGITILASTGLARVKLHHSILEDMPLLPSLEDFFRNEENLNRTLFTIVESEDLVDLVVRVTEEITGDLNLPQTGVLAVLPVDRAYGLNRKNGNEENSSR